MDKINETVANYNELFLENRIFSEKDLKINMDKWGPGTPLWITGTSGDGKSTMARNLARDYGAKVVETDVFLARLNYSKEKWNKYIEKISVGDLYANDIIIQYIDQNPSLPYGLRTNANGWASQETMSKYWSDFFSWFVLNSRDNPRYNKRKLIIEGCNICLYDSEFMAKQPLIIIGCSRLKAGRQRIHRDMSEGHGIIDSIFREIRRRSLYINRLDDSKDNFKKQILSLVNESFSQVYGAYDAHDKWNAAIDIDGKTYRYRVECLIINGDKVFVSLDKNGNLIIPGGSAEKDIDDITQVANECREEARINIKNPIYTGIDRIQGYPPHISKHKSVLPFKYDGSLSKVYVAEYDSDYNGYIDEYDKDEKMIRGKFVPLKDVINRLKPEWREALNKHTNVYYRVTYNGEGIYNALKNNIPLNVWIGLLKSDAMRWLPKPPKYNESSRSYFTKEGFKMFMRKTYPVMRKYLNPEFVNIEEVRLPNKMMYSDKYQVVTESSETKYDPPYNGNPAVRNARDSQIEWEKKHGFDPNEDWGDTNLNESFVDNDLVMENLTDIPNGVNPYSRTKFFHISMDDSLDGKTLTPRIPSWIKKMIADNKEEFIKNMETVKKGGSTDKIYCYEEYKTPRVCFSSSINGCLNAILMDNMDRVNLVGKCVHVYVPEKPISQYRYRTNKDIKKSGDVFDANITNEIWILEPVKVKYYGSIIVDSGRECKFLRKSTNDKNKKISKYNYKWHWYLKERERKENNKNVNESVSSITSKSAKGPDDALAKDIRAVIKSLGSDDYKSFDYKSKKMYYQSVYYDGDNPIGFVFTRSFDEEGRHSLTISVALNPDYRGKGLALKMVRDVLNTIKQDKSIYQIYWGADMDNKGSIELAKRAGFKHNYDYRDSTFYTKVVNDTKTVNESVKRSELPDDVFGIPQERKYPMQDKQHVKAAIKFFNYVEPKYEEQLANRIIENMKIYNIDVSSIGDKNRLKKYVIEGSRYDMTHSLVKDLEFLYFESGDPDIPDLIEPIVKQLESKGYQVKYASPGHTNTRFDNDQNKDGVINAKMRSTARIIFSRDYRFKTTPQGWEWKVLENGSKALYVKPYTYNEKMGSKEEAFKKWQTFYIDNMKSWVTDLPKAGSDAKSKPDVNF